jgi:gamma-glutamyltranspeptidase/glutathione hydrolase
MAFGTPGGDRQDQWALNFFLRHVHFGLHLQAAIDAPTFHTAHFPSSFYPRLAQPGHLAIESRFTPDTIARLRKRGHAVELTEEWSQGRVTAVARGNGVLKAAASARFMQNYAFGR